MKTGFYAGMGIQEVQDRAIAFLICHLKDMVEIPDRLMTMQDHN